MPSWQAEVLAALTGLAVGSYAVTAAIRSLRAESATLGRSRCDGCGVTLSFAHTIPVLSYVRLQGACAACGGRIDPIHLLGEVGGAAVLTSAVLIGDPVRGGLAAVLGFTLLVGSVIDLRTRRLPDALTLLAAAMAAALACQRGPTSLLVGAAVGLVLGLALQGVRLVRRRQGRGPGLGFADVKLVAAMSLWLGAAAPWMLVIAALLGLLAVAVFRPRTRRLPFVPAIALATWIVGLSTELGLWPQVI